MSSGPARDKGMFGVLALAIENVVLLLTRHLPFKPRDILKKLRKTSRRHTRVRELEMEQVSQFLYSGLTKRKPQSG